MRAHAYTQACHPSAQLQLPVADIDHCSTLFGTAKLLLQLGDLLLKTKHTAVGRLGGVGLRATRLALQSRQLDRLDLLPPVA
jgi:hypothetical protein